MMSRQNSQNLSLISQLFSEIHCKALFLWKSENFVRFFLELSVQNQLQFSSWTLRCYTRSLVKSIICGEAHQKHIQYWKNLTKCRHSKFFLRKPLTRTASRRFFNIKKSRLRVLAGTRTITGHFTCNKHLFTIGLK
jgi:hypothetical protein